MSGTTGSVTAPRSERELRKLLRKRDKAEERKLRKQVHDLEPGQPCPVCGDESKSKLASLPLPSQLAMLVRRPGFECKECGLKAQAAPNNLGYQIALVISILCALGGMNFIFAAQRMSDPTERLFYFVGGAVLFGGGLFLSQTLHGVRSPSVLAQKIQAMRRRREHAKATGQLKGKKGKKSKTSDAAAQGLFLSVVSFFSGKRTSGKNKDDPSKDESVWLAENLEAVVVAIILALVIRHFAMEAFVIPTGSMAPTLLGDHFQVDCTNCGFRFDRGKSDSDFHDQKQIPVTSDCPVCDHEFTVERTRFDVTDGDKILVNKFAYALSPPERYDVMVFKYPVEPWKNFIKRLVGLPGETIEIKNGDVYANGVLARKPDHVQDAIWLPVYDARYPRKDKAFQPFWSERADLAGTGTWLLDDDDALVCEPAGEVGSVLEHEVRRIAREHYGYNGYRPYDGEPIADLRIRTEVTPEGEGSVTLAIREDERVVLARFPVGSGEGTFKIEVDGRVVASATAPALRAGQSVPIALTYADDRARVIRDGEAVLTWIDREAPAYTSNLGTVQISAGRARTTFAHCQIDRDIYYVSSGGRFDPSQGEVQVPSDSYFCMGDNSPNSEDGRKWGFVNQDHLVGRAFMVFWPLLPFRIQLIR